MTNEIDDFINDFKVMIAKAFKPLSLLRKVQAKANHAKIIKELYEDVIRNMMNLSTHLQQKI